MLNDKSINSILEMDEDKAKELLIQILSSYSAIGSVQHDQESFIKDVKHIYLKIVRDQYEF